MTRKGDQVDGLVGMKPGESRRLLSLRLAIRTNVLDARRLERRHRHGCLRCATADRQLSVPWSDNGAAFEKTPETRTTLRLVSSGPFLDTGANRRIRLSG